MFLCILNWNRRQSEHAINDNKFLILSMINISLQNLSSFLRLMPGEYRPLILCENRREAFLPFNYSFGLFAWCNHIDFFMFRNDSIRHKHSVVEFYDVRQTILFIISLMTSFPEEKNQLGATLLPHVRMILSVVNAYAANSEHEFYALCSCIYFSMSSIVIVFVPSIWSGCYIIKYWQCRLYPSSNILVTVVFLIHIVLILSIKFIYFFLPFIFLWMI